jgi:hypothetical protein
MTPNATDMSSITETSPHDDPCSSAHNLVLLCGGEGVQDSATVLPLEQTAAVSVHPTCLSQWGVMTSGKKHPPAVVHHTEGATQYSQAQHAA